MDNQGVDLLLKYPLISCQMHNDRRHYTGRVLCGNRDLDLHIIEDKNNTFHLETPFDPEITTTLSKLKSATIVDFLDRLTSALQKNTKTTSNLTNIYRRILQEYTEFTGFHLTLKKCQIAPDLSRISVSTLDEGGREHPLEIAVDLIDAVEIFRPLHPDLPEQMAKNFPTGSGYLTEIYTKFVAAIDGLQGFFDVMDSLDGSCCVVDPERPARGDCYRRIWLDQNLSVMLIVDPLNPRARPEMKFLGPERVVERYLQKLSESLEDWDDNVDFLQSLLNILGLEAFPSKPVQQRVMLMDTGECSICFSLRLNDKLPEVICDNKSCENFYHMECLYEWLISINSKRIFNQLQGQCPNCEKRITCPIPEVTVP